MKRASVPTLQALLQRHREIAERVAPHDEGQCWTASRLPNGDWSVGPDHEMGHRAELKGWCDAEAHLIVAARNTHAALLDVAEAALVAQGSTGHSLDFVTPFGTPGVMLEEERVERLQAALTHLHEVMKGETE